MTTAIAFDAMSWKSKYASASSRNLEHARSGTTDNSCRLELLTLTMEFNQQMLAAADSLQASVSKLYEYGYPEAPFNRKDLTDSAERVRDLLELWNTV